ncbi:MAG: helix-turn-helix domain-containing protein [Bosea sp. (in: a-proteobacteria)]
MTGPSSIGASGAGNRDASGPTSRHLASGLGWSVKEFVCHSGPGDRPFDEKHEAVSIAAVLEGSFNYNADNGRTSLHPGALLFGNPGACFCCGHDHSTGDRCVSLQFSPEAFAEIATTMAGSSRFKFPVSMLPAQREMLPHTVMLEAASGHDPIQMEEHLTRFVATAVKHLAGSETAPLRMSAQDERRIQRTLRHIERDPTRALDLDHLAGVASMSKFHFLRVFKRTVGLSPYQFLLAARLRQAALRLLTSPDAVSRIAFDAGFGDLSTFNATFRSRFGMSPLAYRRQRRSL